MVDEDRYCIDELTGSSPIQAALDKVALGLLDEHARTACDDGEAESRAEQMRRADGGRRAPDEARLTAAAAWSSMSISHERISRRLGGGGA